MTRLTRSAVWLAAAGMAAVGFICSCGPTQPGSGNTQPPTLTAIADRTVYVGEPIDLRVAATDPDGDRVTFSLSGASCGASINPSGIFSWRPTLADTGEKTIVFKASDGAHEVTASTKFIVIMPALADTEAIRFLRPLEGETYRYGDTLTIAFAIKWCAMNAFIEVQAPDQRPTSSQAIDMPARGVTDSTDSQGRVCRFARLFQDRMLWIGYYKLPLVDQVTLTGDTLRLGGGAARIDSIKIKVADIYVDTRGPEGCASTIDAGVPVMFSLKEGVYSGNFSVAPRP